MEMESNQMSSEIHVNYGEGWRHEGEFNNKRMAMACLSKIRREIEEEGYAAKARVVAYKPTIIASFEVRKRRAKK